MFEDRLSAQTFWAADGGQGQFTRRLVNSNGGVVWQDA